MHNYLFGFFVADLVFIIFVFYSISSMCSTIFPIPLLLHRSDSIVTLEPGIPVADVVARRGMNYYKAIITDYGADVTVALTPFTGDADLYVSINPAVPMPNATTADHTSTRGGGSLEAIILQWQELTYCQQQIPSASSSGSCEIFVSVGGFTNASYSITVTTSAGNVPTLLLDGVPQMGAVKKDMYAYYYAHVDVPPSQSFSVYVRTTSGDPDVFCTTDGTRPTDDHYDFYSNVLGGDEYIEVSPGDDGYNATCTLWCAVLGYQASAFAITFSTGSSFVQLQDGVSQDGLIQTFEGYQYFAFLVSDPGSDVSFAITALSGDSDIYVAVADPTDASFRPSSDPDDFTWGSTAFGGDVVTIPSNDEDSCVSACTYLAAIKCSLSSLCRFSITASTSSSSLIQLQNGIPLSNSVAQGSYKYFLFDASPDPTTRNITIRVTAQTGDAQIYVTNLYSTDTSGPSTQLPSNTNSRWASAAGGNSSGSGIVRIPFSDSKVSLDRPVYTIAVYGVIGPSTFTITATSANIPQTLVPGQQTLRHVVAYGATDSYVVNVDSTSQDLVLSATQSSGSVLLTISRRNAAPVCTATGTSGFTCTGTWSTVANIGKGANVLRISASSPCTGPLVTGTCSPLTDWKPGKYFIGVTGLSPGMSLYGLMVATSMPYQRLIDGQPQSSSATIAAAAVFNYQVDYNVAMPDVRFSFSADSEPLYFYLTSCPAWKCTPTHQAPGPNNFQMQGSVDGDSSMDTFLTMMNVAAYCSDNTRAGVCNYFISVYPARPACVGSCAATFSVQASVQSGGQPGIITAASITSKVLTHIGNMPQGKSSLYELFLDPSQQLDLTVTLEACGPGRPTLYGMWCIL
jgi:hypothetical protein